MILQRAAVMLFLFYAASAQAQTWPVRTVRLVVPFPPGGSTDVAARALADRLARALNQQFVVDNRGGAGGVIGTAEVARAAADGHTILFAANQVSTMHLAVKNIPYDMLRDFVPITQVSTQPNAIAAHISLPVKTVRELVVLARSRPGELTWAHPGPGSGQHMTGEWFARMAKIELTGVPYKGGGQAVIDLVGGQVTLCVLGSTPLIPHHKSGRIRIVAFTSPARFAQMPEIPTLHESGYRGFDSIQWLGLLAPRGTSTEIVQRLHAEVTKALALPEIRERLAAAALQPVGNTPQQFADVIRSEIERWTKVAQVLGLQPQ